MGREKAARKAHGALKTQSFTGPGARQALGQSIKSKLHLSADEQKLADKGHILDEKGDAWWRRIGYADSREEFLKFWTALRPEFREGPVPPPDGTTCKRCKMHVNLSRKPVTRNNVHRSRKNCDGGCWGQESVTLIRLWCETHELKAEDAKKTFGTYSREAQGCPYQNKDVVPSEALEAALKGRGELCQHGEAWARRIGASDDPEKLKAFTALWWDLAPQFRSWDVPPDDGRKCAQCACIFRLGFYRGTKWRDRCECNKGAKRLADEWKLMGYECYQKGLREKELVKPVQKAPKKKDAPPSPRIEAMAPDVAIDELELHVKDEVVNCVEINQCVGCLTLPCWLRRAVRNRHRHAIEQASRRWRGGRRDDSARTRRKSWMSTQVVKEEPSPQQPTRKKKAKKKTNVDLAAQLFAGPPQARDLVGVAGSVETAPPPTESPWAAPTAVAEDPPLPSKPPQLPSPVRPRQNSWNPAEDPPLPEPGVPAPAPEPIPSSIYEPPPQQKEEPKKTGVVIWFSPVKNQGFLKPDDGSPDVWVHGDGVRPGVAIKKDDRVSYREEVYGRQARLKAVDVGKYRPAAKPTRQRSLRAPPPQFDAALERALAESADAYAHHQAPPTANYEDDELQRALKASADEFADEQRRRAAQAAPAPQYNAPPAPQYNAPPAPQYNAQPTPQYDPPYVPPSEPRRSLADLAGPPHNNGYAHVDDDLARALAASREAEEIDARRRRDLAAAEERLRAARLAAAPPPAAPPAPPGLPPGFGGGPPPGLPPGLAGFPAAPKLPRDPLAAFLDGAGMGRYLGLFRDEEIRTLEDFRLLTAQDLHDIGLPPHDAAVLHQRTAAHYLANGL